MDLNLPDFTKLNWQLNIAILGAIFSIFSLIYNDYFIFYGFITVAFGVVSVTVLNAVEKIWFKNIYIAYFIAQSILTTAWIIACIVVYSNYQ